MISRFIQHFGQEELVLEHDVEILASLSDDC